MKTTLVRSGLLALAMAALLVGRAPAPDDKSADAKKDKTAEVKKDDGKKEEGKKEGGKVEDGKKKEAEAAPKEKATGIAALRQRVADLRDLAADLKKSDRDKAAARVTAIADALSADIDAMEKAKAAHGHADKPAAEPGREGDKGKGVGHGKPTEPGTGKPETVGPPAEKATKEGKKTD